jgi:hypothetical protein
MKTTKRVNIEIQDVNIQVDVEVNISKRDVLDYINDSDDIDKEEIARKCNWYIEEPEINEEFITFDNLHDREKVLLLKEIFEKCTINDIQNIVKNLK